MIRRKEKLKLHDLDIKKRLEIQNIVLEFINNKLFDSEKIPTKIHNYYADEYATCDECGETVEVNLREPEIETDSEYVGDYINIDPTNVDELVDIIMKKLA